MDRFRTPRGRFGLWVGLSLIPLLVLWWLGAGLMIDLLRKPTELLAGLFQLSVGIAPGAEHGWVVDTGLSRASGTESGAVALTVSAEDLRRMLLSFPLFLAFVIAPPRRRPIRTLVVGGLILALVFCMSACAEIFNSVAVVVNHHASIVTENAPPPSFTVTRAPMSPLAFFLAGLGMYLSIQVLPLAVPVGLWAWLNFDGLATLFVRDAEDGATEEAAAEASSSGDR